VAVSIDTEMNVLLADAEHHEAWRHGAPGVLVAEPAAILADTQMAIELEGFTVVAAAATAAEAVEAACAVGPALCLIGAELPGGVARAVRELRDRGIPTQIAVLTAAPNRREALTCLRAGADGYLVRDAAGGPPAGGMWALVRGEAAVPRVFTPLLLQELRRAVVLPRGDGPLKRRLLYFPRLLRHLRRRLRSGMALREAWASARLRMEDYG
jgi:DNA-binding NarL/FixJ family response regulator